MAFAELEPYSPPSSGEIPILDVDRAASINRKHQLLAEYISLKNVDGLLLRSPANFAWFTCGTENTRPGTVDPVAALFITRDVRVILTSNVDSSHIFDHQLNGLGFQVKERPWQEINGTLCNDMCRGRNVLYDTGPQSIDSELQDFRRTLTDLEAKRIRVLAKEVTHAVEATARSFTQGENESEVAGHLAHRLLRHGITPYRLQVMADFQGHRYRHWGFGTDTINRHCVLSAIGRRNGLYVGVSRSVCFGQPPASIVETHNAATLVLATAMHFSLAGWSIGEVWKRVHRIYEKFGVADEWRLADQGETLGYDQPGLTVRPDEPATLGSGTVLHWHPGVRFALTGETVLVQPEGPEWLTVPDQWPMLGITVKGEKHSFPDVLCRETATGWE